MVMYDTCMHTNLCRKSAQLHPNWQKWFFIVEDEFAIPHWWKNQIIVFFQSMNQSGNDTKMEASKRIYYVRKTLQAQEIEKFNNLSKLTTGEMYNNMIVALFYVSITIVELAWTTLVQLFPKFIMYRVPTQ